jgi:adenylosuccinate synthase
LKEKLQTLVSGYQSRFPSLKVDIDKELSECLEYKKKLEPLVCDTVLLMHKAITENKKILVEGANAVMLDIDFGTYPFVTSSNCTAGVVCTGLGIPPRSINCVYGVFKAYTTRVGGGAFPTELHDNIGKELQEKGREFGVTTGRKRRCGWFDVMVARYSAMVNGYTSIALTKIDIMDEFDLVKIGVGYIYKGKKLESIPAEQSQLNEVTVEYEEVPGWKSPTAGIKVYSELPLNARKYIERIQELVGVHSKLQIHAI